MARRRVRLRLVIDTMAVIRGARALRQRPPVPGTPELKIILSWIEDQDAFDWLFSDAILDEYREVLRRLKVPRNAVGRFINLLREAGVLVEVKERAEYSPDPKDDPFYHCAIDGDADYIVTDNTSDFPPVKGRKRPKILTPAEAVRQLSS
jgi:putative PIN family toxin of toxin-antitoxin system